MTTAPLVDRILETLTFEGPMLEEELAEKLGQHIPVLRTALYHAGIMGQVEIVPRQKDGRRTREIRAVRNG
jgi:hypothetical protein